MDLILSTRNPSKANQIRAVFDGSFISIRSLDEADIEGEAIEDGSTLEENALKKACFAWERSNKWSVADDTGLFIDALNGEPGIFSARWAGEHASTEEIMQYTLERLRDVPPEKRTGAFRTYAVLVSPLGNSMTFVGEVRGRILEAPRVPCQPKMPYSAIFVPDGQPKVWAEMSTDEENAISHRGQAFRKVRAFIEQHA